MKGKILLVSPDVFPEAIKIFAELGMVTRAVPRYPALAEPVSAHPDILFSVLSDGRLLTDPVYFCREREFFAEFPEGSVLPSSAELSGKYPLDIAFDAIKEKDLLVGSLAHTAPELKADAKRLINVRQGYAKCSTLVLDGRAVTADKGIADALEGEGYDVLRISPGHVALPGYGYGFIGGASVYLREARTVVFFGDLGAHPDGGRIEDFLRSAGVRVMFPSGLPLTDFGGGVMTAW